MNTREQLNQYVRNIEARLRWLTVSKGAAIAAGVALGATIALVLVTNALAFSAWSLIVARVVLFLALAIALGFALVIPLMRMNARRAARRAESAFPEFEERLLTFVERSDRPDSMLDLLAADTATVAQRTEVKNVAPPRSIFGFATSAGAAGAVLIWLIAAGPGYFGYGAQLLWAGMPKGTTGAYYDIIIDPGNKLVRRKSDQMVTATLHGFAAPQVKIYARYKSASKWEEAPMLPRSSGSAYEYLFAALAEPVEYYAEAAGIRSKVYKLDVIDEPVIQKVRVTYHFPSWLKLPDAVEDPGGDLRAVAGTTAELTVVTDKPLKNGQIELDDGSHVGLEPVSGNTLTAKVLIQKDGMYHFASVEQGQSVRLSEDYFIEAREDNPPEVKIVQPRADARVSPIEEVRVNVEAEDDFALEGVELHYSVNGDKEKVLSLLPKRGVKSASGGTVIALEDFKLSPGDVVAMYATARDARTTSRTDIMFIETQPYERNFTQAQQMGGAGGGAQDQDENRISEREKEIIAATWNEIRGGGKDKVNSAENAKFLSEVQTKLKEQALSLAQRARSRELAGANQEFQSFTKDMEAAASAMTPASDKLKTQSWKDAIEPETKALQHLLRAEATFKDIQVAFGNRGGGGGGSAGRDLANLFDLELDTEKNQYETGQQASSSGEQRQKQIDEALQRLEELARRQKELADQQRNQKQQSFEQRWQQEMLRREAEELRKQMEQLAQQSSGGQQSQSSQSQSSSQQSSSSQGGSQSQSQSGQQSSQQQARSGRMGSNDQRLRESLEQLRRATDEMRSAQSASEQGGQTAQSEAEARRAADRLKDSTDLLRGMRKDQASASVSDLADRAQKLADHQRDFSNRLRQTFGDQLTNPQRYSPEQTQGLRQQAQQLADEKDKIASDTDQLERDMQKAARDMAGTQPAASARIRDGLSELQQGDIKNRSQFSAGYIRRGQGGYMVPREAPITEALDKAAEDLRNAERALGNGSQPNNPHSDAERSLAQIERMRAQMERMAGRNPQSGQQNGGQQNGGQQNGGQQNGGQQSGGQQAGGRQAGGNQYGGGDRQPGYGIGRDIYGPGTWYGRFVPDGIYRNPEDRPVDPQRTLSDAARGLVDLRNQFKDDPDMMRQITDVEREISRLQVGDISSQELQNRLNREILPNLEALELQLRKQAEQDNGDQVRSAASDKVPAGYMDAVAEYFRKLSKGK